MTSQPRGNVIIDVEECKGCGLCVESCPPKCLILAPELSKYGVHPAHLHRAGLHRLRRVFLLLPGARRHHRVPADAAAKGWPPRSARTKEVAHAATL